MSLKKIIKWVHIKGKLTLHYKKLKLCLQLSALIALLNNLTIWNNFYFYYSNDLKKI